MNDNNIIIDQQAEGDIGEERKNELQSQTVFEHHSSTDTDEKLESDSSDDGDESENSNQEDDEHDTNGNDDESMYNSNNYQSMPFFKYSRVMGSLQRIRETEYSSTELSNGNNYDDRHGTTSTHTNKGNEHIYIPTLRKKCICSTLGQINITPSSTSNVSLLHTSTKFHVLALGMADGTVHLLDPITGTYLLPNYLNTTSGDTIISMSFDSGARNLAVIMSLGDVHMFEFKYAWNDDIENANLNSFHQTKQQPQSPIKKNSIEEDVKKSVSTNSNTFGTNSSRFDMFLSKLAGSEDEYSKGTTSVSTNTNNKLSTPENKSIPNNQNGNMLYNHPISIVYIQPTINVARFTYKLDPSSSTRITCMVIDPAYGHKRAEKSIIVGLNDGKLILTKRSSHGGSSMNVSSDGTVPGSGGGSNVGGVGSAVAGGLGAMGLLFMQPKRNDIYLYQGTGSVSSDEYDGIEAVTWRGNLCAWADASGIKLFDIDSMSRIAHIDRPSGARASLYPTISSLKPTLLFQRSDSLLIAWGDCLMDMRIVEKEMRQTINTGNQGGELSSSGVTQRNLKKRSVECEMAWELDCIACGVIPLDDKHVGLMGLIPVNHSDNESDNFGISPSCEQKDKSLPTEISNSKNLVTFEVISRDEGTILSSDILPLLSPLSSEATNSAASEYSLVSSFSTSRMENWIEKDDIIVTKDEDQFGFQKVITDAVGGNFDDNRNFPKFTDPHSKWKIENLRDMIKNCDEIVDESKDDESASSISTDDSDDYSFIFGSRHELIPQSSSPSIDPFMVIISPYDVVLSQACDIDDAISYSRSSGLHATALKQGLGNRTSLRRHTVRQLIDEYFEALMCQSSSSSTHDSSQLTVHRLKLAAKATPILLGGDASMWGRWILEFAKIPGSLFVLQPYIPVRDPKLPPLLYDIILDRMFDEINDIVSKSPIENEINILYDNAVAHYLKTLRKWGSVASLKERIRIQNLCVNRHKKNISAPDSNKIQTSILQDSEESLNMRLTQSATRFLQQNSHNEMLHPSSKLYSSTTSSGNIFDALFDVGRTLRRKLQTLNDSIDDKKAKFDIQTFNVECIAELYFIMGDYRNSLRYYLLMAAQYPILPLSTIEDDACRRALKNDFKLSVADDYQTRYEHFRHVLIMVETYHMFDILLEENILESEIGAKSISLPKPIVALTSLVGLEMAGQFFREHSILSESSKTSVTLEDDTNLSSLPLNVVAERFGSSPKLLFWYLQLIFSEKPEIYVTFPSTAVPPRKITDLHQIHFELFIKFTERTSRSNLSLSDVPSYDELERESPFVAFLKATLPHGGIRSDDVRKTLEEARFGDSETVGNNKSETRKVKFPHLFANELAYIIERSGSGSEEDAKTILSLYLEGAVTLPLAVAFCERNTSHSTMLWDMLISFCLKENSDEKSNLDSSSGASETSGYLFGCLLEVAARSGADLSNLVAKIPIGMCIRGISPKLVAAISDYQLKTKIYGAAAEVFSRDKVFLLQQHIHRSRRGLRVVVPDSNFELSKTITDVEDYEFVFSPKEVDCANILRLKRSQRL